MKKIIITLVVLIVVIGLVFLGLKSCQQDKSVQSDNTEEVKIGNISKTVVATGKIEALFKAEVKSKIGGIVKRFYVEEGEKVNNGEKLVEILPQATPVELVQARTEVKAAAFDKEISEKQYLRSKELFENKFISPNEFDQAKVNYETSKVRFYASMAQLRVLEQGANLSQLVEGIQLSEEDKRQIETEAQEAINSMTLKAPISGIVLSLDTDKGSAVIPVSSAYGGTVIMTIADVSEKQFRGDVDEADIGKVSLGLSARVYVEAYPEEPFEAKLTHISPQGQELEDIINFEIRATVEDPADKLRVGMSADAELILEEHQNVLLIPEGAVIYEDGQTYVNIKDDSIEEGMQRVQIERGISDGLLTEVLSGLKQGQIVVIPR